MAHMHAPVTDPQARLLELEAAKDSAEAALGKVQQEYGQKVSAHNGPVVPSAISLIC